MRPSEALRLHRDEIRSIVESSHASNPMVKPGMAKPATTCKLLLMRRLLREVDEIPTTRTVSFALSILNSSSEVEKRRLDTYSIHNRRAQ